MLIFSFQPNYAEIIHIPESKASLLIGYLSIASTLSRVLFGLVLNHPRINRFHVLQVCKEMLPWQLYLALAQKREIYLLYRYWWNTRIFPLTKKSYLHRAQSYLHRAQWIYYFYLSRVRTLESLWLLIWLANYKNYKSLKKLCFM